MTEQAAIFQSIVEQRRSMRIYDASAPFDTEAVKRSIERAALAPNSSNMQMWEFYHIREAKTIADIAVFCMSQNAAKTARELVIIAVPKAKYKARAQANFQFHHARYGGVPVSQLDRRSQRKLRYFSHLMRLYYFQDWFGISGYIRKCIVGISSLWRPVVWQVSKQDLRVVCHKSAALAAQTFMLSMTAEGYATCPMEGFDSKKLRKYLGLPRSTEFNMIISCGPGTKEGIYHERFRVPFEEIYFVM